MTSKADNALPPFYTEQYRLLCIGPPRAWILSVWYLKRPKEGLRSSVAGVIGGCQTTSVSARLRSSVSTVCALNSRAISLAHPPCS